jgi:acetyltransferase-like isoleucine patch superfamily enzyme
MTIKQIFDEIAAEPGTNQKMVILAKYRDNELLERVLYLANSKRVKFYIKQIPEQTVINEQRKDLEFAVQQLSHLYNRDVTGDVARNFLKGLLESLAADDAYIIERIIEKDCRLGMGTTNINKIFKGLIEDTPYMGAISFDEKKARVVFEGGKSAYSQIKMDGRYCNAIIRSGEVELESRQGEATVVTGATFLEELATFPDCVLNGELTIDGISRYESNGIIASIISILSKKESRSTEENAKHLAKFESKHGSFLDALLAIRFTVWDAITIDEYFEQRSTIEYWRRLYDLRRHLAERKSTMISEVAMDEVENYEEAIRRFQEALADGQEGTILKASDGGWKDGKPNWQIKMKLEMDVDLRITGFNYGSGKNCNVISSVNAESSDGKVVTRPTGINEAMMQHITDNQEALLGTIVECKCSGLSQDAEGNYSLLHPVFKSLRDDKDTCDDLQSIIAIENMVKGLN